MSILERFGHRLPAVDPSFHCTLGEGNTPLLRSRAVGAELGLQNLFFKCEQQNPTGSYKDRFIAVELSLLREKGAKSVVATSSGNTGSALSAFAARYCIPCHLFVCEKTPAGKLLQMKAHGAQVYRVRGFCMCRETTDLIMSRLNEISLARNTRPTISAFKYAPEGMQGVQTIAYEVTEQLGVLGMQAQHVFAPAGGCGMYVAIGRGFLQDAEVQGTAPPRMHIVQPRLNDTAVTALRKGEDVAQSSPTTTTLSGLAVPQVIDGNEAIEVARQTSGNGFLIEDDDARFWQQKLLREEGIWVEPAGAVSVAGLAAAAREGVLAPDEPVVCILTGHGFKDPASALQEDGNEPMIEPDDLARVLA